MTSKFLFCGPKGFTDFDKRPFTQIIYDSLKKYGKNAAFIDVNTEETILYEELLQKSFALTIAFQELEFKKGDVICILVENHLKYFIPFLSALFSGLTSHLVNPEFSKYELEHIIPISKPTVIIASNHTLENAIHLRSKYDFIKTIINVDSSKMDGILEMDNLIELYKNQSDSLKLESFDDANQDAVILNSSGTTGMPKGVLMTHLNLKCILNYSTGKQYFDVTSDDTLLLYLPNFHVFGVLLFVSMVTAGATGIVFSKFSLRKMLGSVDKYRVNKLFVVPPTALLLAKSPLIKEYDLSSIKQVMCGAASLGMEVAKLFEDRFGIKIRQLYGLSELTGIITICQESNKLSSSVGRLIPGASATILDVITKEPLPPLKTGELCFKGPMVMKGYFKNAEATKNMIDKNGFLHSGDLGYYDSEGNIFIMDRLKDLIKCKGWQVAPAELEDLIKSHSKVNEAAVIGVPDEVAGEVAMAFVVKDSNSDITDLDIIKFVSDNVIAPKRLHGGVRFVNEIPKNPSGKIMRYKLKEQINFERKP